MRIVAPADISLDQRARVWQSAPVAVDKLTSEISIALRRPTTGNPLAWGGNDTVRVSLVMVVDGQEHRCSSQVTGGIRRDMFGAEMPEYRLTWHPTVYMDNGIAKRLGQRGAICAAYVAIELLRGSCALDLLGVDTVEKPAPDLTHHNSVAFDAAQDVGEFSGDGNLSVTHTATGSDRAAFVALGNSAGTPLATSSVTYASVGMTSMWDVHDGSFIRSSGHQLVAPATGAQTVNGVLTAGIDQACMAVITMTGVDQTTPVGTHVTDNTISQTPSVSVSGVGTDDMVVDFVVAGASITEAGSAAGAGQTTRTEELVNNTYFGSSTQPGSSGGAMSWSLDTTPSFGTLLAAQVFKAAGGGGATILNRTVFDSPIFKSRLVA